MIERLPRYAETTFASLCAKAGALCQRVEEDESGWDFLVEFRQRNFDGPSDTHPPRDVAFVQVKSANSEDKRTCRVKLSNALRAAQDRQPWFLILMVAADDTVRVFAKHIWEKEIRRSLEAVRQAENERVALNDREITFRFEEAEEHTEDLIGWMSSTITASASEYAQAKKDLYENVGYEGGSGILNVTIDTRSKEAFLENLLGIGNGVPLREFSFTPSRFGLVSPEPQYKGSAGTLQITPNSVATAEVRLVQNRKRITLRGEVFVAELPYLVESRRVRVRTDFLDLIWGDGAVVKCNLKVGADQRMELPRFEKFLELTRAFGQGEVELQVWSEGNRILHGSLNANRGNAQSDWTSALEVVRFLRSLAGDVQENEIKISLQDLYGAKGLKTIHEVCTASSLRIEFEYAEPKQRDVSSIVYCAEIDVGDHFFGALMQCQTREDIVIGSGRRITAERSEIIESFVRRREGGAKCNLLVEEYKNYILREKTTKNPLALGDICAFITSKELPEQ